MTLLTILKELVEMRSVSADRKTCLETLKKIQPQIPDALLDAKSEVLIWGHTDLSTTSWLINTHLDVVPGNPEQFSLTIKGDKAFGRGAADVKGCVAILINQSKEWETIAKEKMITFMLVTDEEIGGSGTRQLLGKMQRLQGAIFLEPTSLHLVIEAKGMMQIKIESSGKSVHGSRPWDGINAIEKIMTGLTKFRLDHPQSLLETRGTTFNFSQISGGTAINQVPDHAELWCDVRTKTCEDQNKIIEIFKASFDSCTVMPVVAESPIICDKQSRVFKTLIQSLKACSLNPLTQFSHLTSDARHATKNGIPAIVFGPKGGNLHGDNEWVSLKSLDKVQKVLDHWIKNI